MATFNASEPVITTVIPTYQRQDLLQHAVRSALAQTWPHVRVSIFDNASADGTAEVAFKLRSHDDRVRYHRHSVNIGAYANFNAGVRAVETPLFSVLSDDDVLMPDFYATAIGAFKAHPDAMFVAMPTLEIDDEGLIIGGPGVYGSYEQRYFAAGEAYGRVPGIWTGYVFRREIVDDIGFVNELAGPAADVGFVRHVSARYPGVVVPKIAALLRFHSGSVSAGTSIHAKAQRSFWASMAESLERDRHVPASIRTTVRASLEDMYVGGLKRGVLGSLVDGHREDAIKSVSILKELGYVGSGYLLRLAVALHDLVPGVPFALRMVARRRRVRYQEHLKSMNEQYSGERERFLSLLHGQ